MRNRSTDRFRQGFGGLRVAMAVVPDTLVRRADRSRGSAPATFADRGGG